METPVRADGVRRLVVTLHGGDVALSDSGGTHIEGIVESAHEARISQHDSWLTINAGGRRDTSVRLAVPAGIDVHIRARAGDITARIPLGSVSVAAASGDIRLSQVAGPLEAYTDSGDLDITDLEGHGRVRSGSGDVTLGRLSGTLEAKSGSGDIRVASNRGRIVARCGSGDVYVGVPDGVATWLDLTSASGDVAVNLDEGDPAGPDTDGHAEVQVTSASGDIAIVRA